MPQRRVSLLTALVVLLLPALAGAADTPPAWEAYRWHLLAAVGVILVESALIGVLLLHRRRRRRAEGALQERLGFETLVSELSASFVDVGETDADAAVQRGLARVGEHLRLDAAWIMTMSADRTSLRVTHGWSAPGVAPAPAGIDAQRFPWLLERLATDAIRFADLDALPPEATTDRKGFASLGIPAAVVVPHLDGPAVMGAIVWSLHPGTGLARGLPERLEFVAGIFSSLLRRRRSGLELQALRRELTHVGRLSALGELAVSLAHELNQPLTAILTNAQVAQRLLDRGMEEPKEVREILAEIVADDKRAGEVIRRLRSFVKKDLPRRAPLDVNAVIQDVLLLVHSDTVIRHVAVIVDLAAHLPPVSADRVQLQQVVLNLVLNGLDAMRGQEHGRLVVTTAQGADGDVQAAITDGGAGIPQHDLGRIFEAFYTTKPHGLGMGLSIARSLIEAHGGRLWARNNPDAGATFTFTLPADRAEVDATKV